MRAVFFSDVHLDRDDQNKSELVTAFIEETCSGADVVAILGDLFEFYHGYEDYIFPWYRPIAEALRRVSQAGTKVYFLEGNHEFGMGRHFESYTGAVVSRTLTLHLDDKRVFLSHGDDIDNLMLARILRSSLSYRTMDFLGPLRTWSVAGAIGFFLSKKVKGYSQKVIAVFRAFARRRFVAGCDAVILAHSHISDSLEVAGKDGMPAKVYLNCGDFVRERSYVEYITGEGFSLKTYRPESA